MTKNKCFSIIESYLFMNEEPKTLSEISLLFEDLKGKKLENLLEEMKGLYEKEERGIKLLKVGKGWMLRTKEENKECLLKTKPRGLFRLSKPSLETLALIAFEGPCPKMRIDETRGLDSSHLLRTLIEKNLVEFAGKSTLPGKPSLYKTTQHFLEVFGLEDLNDLPSKKEIEEMIMEKPKDPNSLESLDLPPSPIEEKASQDEQTNKELKEALKSLPSTVSYLEEEKRKEKEEKKEEETPPLEME